MNVPWSWRRVEPAWSEEFSSISPWAKEAIAAGQNVQDANLRESAVWESMWKGSGCYKQEEDGEDVSYTIIKGMCLCLEDKFGSIDNVKHPWNSLRDIPTTEGDLQMEALRCLVSSKIPTTQGLFSESRSFWVSNVAALVGLWNLISVTASVRYLHIENILVNTVITMVLCVTPLIFFVQATNMFSSLGHIVAISMFVFGASAARSFVQKAPDAAKDDNPTSSLHYDDIDTKESEHDKILVYDWVFWISYLFILPIAFTIHNIAWQRKEIEYNISSIVLAMAIGASTIGAGFFNKGWGYMHSASVRDLKLEILQDAWDKGAVYSSVANYGVLACLILIVALLGNAYPEFSTLSNAPSVLAGTTWISIALLLSIVVVENSLGIRSTVRSHVTMHRARAVTEAVARGAVTIAVAVDVLALVV